MVEQMVCERNKAHCSPIRRRFLKIIVAALLLNTAEAQTERAPWLERTKTSDLIARRDARAQQKHGPAAIFASSNAASKLRSPIASFSPMKGKIATLTAIEASETRKTCGGRLNKTPPAPNAATQLHLLSSMRHRQVGRYIAPTPMNSHLTQPLWPTQHAPVWHNLLSQERMT